MSNILHAEVPTYHECVQALYSHITGRSLWICTSSADGIQQIFPIGPVRTWLSNVSQAV
jgi:hypothetical protein